MTGKNIFRILRSIKWEYAIILIFIVKKVQEMKKYMIYDIFLFATSIIVGLLFLPLEVDIFKYLIVFSIYLLFSAIYSNLRITYKTGNVSYDYGVSYSQSFALFAGPFGLLFFEFVHRFIIYFQRKYTKTADEDEFTDTLYNIGSHVINNTIAYILFFALYPFAQNIPFGYFILFSFTAIVMQFLSYSMLIYAFYISGNLHSWTQVVEFLKTKSILDIGKNALTNGLLFYFIVQNQWEMLIVLFILNYMVNKSFLSKQERIQNELERDRFREMAYTDFMTGLSNRAMMDKQMDIINGTGEALAIVVADIDKFKRINDNYNHAIGDIVIQNFANTLKTHVSSQDYVFRSGGEEFTLFLRGRSYAECVEFLESLRKHVGVHPVEVEFNGEQTSIFYTVSFGLYFNNMSEELKMERAYIYADQLLLEAKEIGRNRIEVRNGQEYNKFPEESSPQS